MRKLAVFFLLIAEPASAETITFPIAVPQECFELAQREGVPTMLSNRYQATRAKLKLYRLKDSDPLVHACRQAVERAKKSVAKHHD